jgi:hypothetical protein
MCRAPRTRGRRQPDPRYLRCALVEAATHACTAAVYRERYQQTKAPTGKQRGAKVAQVDLARRPSEANWHMLSRVTRAGPNRSGGIPAFESARCTMSTCPGCLLIEPSALGRGRRCVTLL